MDPEDRTANADAGDVGHAVAGADLHVAATDPRGRDRPSSLPGASYSTKISPGQSVDDPLDFLDTIRSPYITTWRCDLQMYERLLPCVQHHTSPTAIPVYQRPSELYQEPTSKRKSHGVDFNNLILLTKSSSKTRRGHAKAAAQQPLLLESTQRDPRAGQNMAQWLDKDCARRTKGVVTVNALVSELRSYEEKYEHSRAGTSWAATTDSPPRHRSCSEGARSKDGVFGKEASRCRLADAEERDRRTKRPLYRDVLANATSGQHGIVLENVFERR